MKDPKNFNSRIFNKPYEIDSQEILRIPEIKELIGTGKFVLDVGCRDGTISKIIEEQGNKVECVEISDYCIGEIKKKGLQVYDLDLNTNWADSINKRYDTVFAGEIIEHLFETDIFLSNIHKVLKVNGELIITTPNTASLGRRILLLLGKSPAVEVTTRDYDAGHVRYFVYSTLKKVLEENGFEVILFTSDLVNFNFSGSLKSRFLAKIIPTIGRSLIIKAKKR